MDGDYEKIPGRKKGTTVLVDLHNWVYYHKNGHGRYRCYSYVLEGCSAGIVEDDDGIFVPTGPPHHHANHKREIHHMMLVQAIRVRLHNEPRSIKEIYDEEVERMNIRDVTFATIRSTLQRERRSRQPPNPLSVIDADNLINEFPMYSF
ncbi:uncharacterized protein LOC124336984 [Daphnia pulicaria]|uniref:uncharacterized protein LOC124336984 n=1 Tax=Daphnia pulicaria TaxID=35523 RepID=UPI001EEB60AB|nr:uncharacterized protein LOC124336984 [Daphnia pulicaria]